MEILKLEQELKELMLKRDTLNKIPVKSRNTKDLFLLDDLRASVKRIRARIKSIKNKKTYTFLFENLSIKNR